MDPSDLRQIQGINNLFPSIKSDFTIDYNHLKEKGALMFHERTAQTAKLCDLLQHFLPPCHPRPLVLSIN
jgi:hypothetical protein